MAITPQDIAARAGETAKSILGIPAGVIGDAYAGYIKNPPAEGLIPNLGVGVARQACRRYADNPNGVPGSVATGFERVCRPYLEDIGYGAGPQIKPPFEGGQCPTVYTGRVFIGDTEISQGGGAPRSLTGPLGGVTRTEVVTNQPASGGVRVTWTFGNDSANNFLSIQYIPGFTPPPRFTLERADGQPDSCGNPPPVVTGPVPPSTPGAPTEPYNPTPDIDVDITVDIGPDGDITFDIGGPSITIDPFGGGGDGGGGEDNPGIDQPGTAPSSGLPPGDIGTPAQPADTGEDGIAAGCAPPNSVLVGIKIDILAVTGPVSEYDPLVRRGVCYAYMGTPGNLALEPSGVALRSGQMLFAPLDNLTCYEVRANVGFSLRVTPYYRALELTEV